jgi:hypothetical protein
MLESLRLRNYRCFQDHEMPFRPLSILVGKNNAGKSSIAEALRLVALVTARYDRLPFHNPPADFKLPLSNVGIRPSLKGIEIEYETLFHRYSEAPARLTAMFGGGATVDVFLGKELVHAVLRDNSAHVIKTQAGARKLALPRVSILPQIGPLQRQERLLSPEHVMGALDSRLAHLHFRNQVQLLTEHYASFRQTIESTWPGLSLIDLVKSGSLTAGYSLSLNLRDRDFVAEIGAMGHGLQMWLQTMWFLTRCCESQVVILDEPDVYLHADLQRRLIGFLRDRFPQVLLTTHSVEILSDVEPENVLIVDRERPRSEFATSVPAVQTLLARIGTVHNLGLSRLWKASKLLFVEGGDVGMLKRLHRTLFPSAPHPLDVIPCVSIGGWSGWPYAVGSSLLLRNSAGEDIRVYCLLDRDYRTARSIAGRETEAKSKGIRLHIWKCKELENYLMSPACISRVVASRAGERTPAPSSQEVASKILEFAEALREEAFDAMSQEHFDENRSRGLGAANTAARTAFREREDSVGIANVVSGKGLLSKVSAWTQSQFGVCLNAGLLAAELLDAEIPSELRLVLDAIEHATEIRAE